MNAMLNIQVNVAGRQAQMQLRALQTQMGGLNGAALTGGNAFRAFHKAMSLNGLEKFGKNLQWTGRQLEFSFTLPLLLAGGMATKWALENEAAVTKVRKVYGDLSMSQRTITKEVDALAESFRLLSDRFGVAQKDVIDIGAAWAQAGSSGVAVAKQTRMTLEAMILGELDATEAVKGLIAIQAGYQISTTQLKEALADLNIIENQTAIGFDDLITVMQKASGTARTAGVSIDELGAMAAALVPAAGSASEAGNALKTLISRIMAPTADAKEALSALGIEFNTTAWQAKNATERIEIIASRFGDLATSEQNFVASALAGRRQISRLAILLRDVASSQGFYARALDATSDKQRSAAKYAQELATYLSSQPQAFKILTRQLQNFMAQAIVPLLPTLLAILARITRMVQAFTKLSPRVQQTILMFLLLLAVLGPFIRLMGASVLLFSQIGKAAAFSMTMLFGHALSAEQAAIANGALTMQLYNQAIAQGNVSKAALIASGRLKVTSVQAGRTGGLVHLLGDAFMATGRKIRLGLAMAFDFIRLLPFYVMYYSSQAIAFMRALPAMMVSAWQTAVTWLYVTMVNLPGAIASAWQTAITAIYVWWTTAMSALAGAWTTLTTWMYVVWSDALIAMSGAWSTFTTWVGLKWLGLTGAFTTATTWMGVQWYGMTGALSSAWAAFVGFYSGALSFIGSTWTGITTWIGTTWGALVGWLSTTWASFTTWFSAATAVSGAWTAFVTFIGVSWATLTAALSTAWTAFTGWVGTTFAPLAIAWSSLLTWMGVQWATLTAGMSATWAGFTTSVVGMMSAIGSAFSTAVIGPIMTGLSYLASAVAAGVAAIAAFFGIPVWAVVAIIAAVIAAIVVLVDDELRGNFINALQAMVDGLAQLPGIIASIFRSVVRVISQAMTAVIDWLSYLNPFARHSPSLVENVTAGVQVILSQYGHLGAGIKAALDTAIDAHNAFLNSTSGASYNLQMQQFAIQRKQVLSASPQSGGEVDALIANILRLKSMLPGLQAQINKQNDAVARWQRTVNGLSDATEKLADIQKVQITGMRAADNAIFANEMAQKRLRLEILRLEDAGGAVDDLRARMAALQGEIESLQSQREDLRLAGAGSDVLSAFDAQIAALEQQKQAITDSASEMDDLKKQYEELQRQGEILDLQKSINFDPQLRQLDQMFNVVKEMSFEQIQAEGALQMARVAQLQAAQNQLDIEKQKASDLRDVYTEISQRIDEMTSALSQFASAAESAQNAWASANASTGGSGAAGAAALDDPRAQANFDIPGGGVALGREGDLFDIEEFNRQMEEELASLSEGLGDFDIFGPIKDAWNAFWGWLKSASDSAWDWLWDGFFDLIRWIGDLFQWLGRGLMAVWNTAIWPIVKAIGNAFVWLWNTILKPVLTWLWNQIQTFIVPILRVLWSVAVTAFNAIAAALSWLWNTILKPVFEWLYNFFTGYILPVLQLFAAIVKIVFVLVGRLAMILWDILSAVLGWIWDKLKNLGGVFRWLGTVVATIFGAIAAAGVWLWNTILYPVLHAIWTFIRDRVGPVFSWLWNSAIVPAWDGIRRATGAAWDWIKPKLQAIKDFIHDKLGPAFEWFKELVSDVWGGIKRVTKMIWNEIADILESGINAFIMAFNAIARGVRAVAGFLDIDVTINTMDHVNIPAFAQGGEIPRFAKGGIPMSEVGAGFVTRGPRAIVGEGSPSWPEFVIPTDPRYRNRAHALYNALGDRLAGNRSRLDRRGFGGDPGDVVPGYLFGGVLDGAADWVGGMVGSITSTARDAAVAAIWTPIHSIVNAFADRMGDSGFPGMLGHAIEKFNDMLYEWAKGKEEESTGLSPEALERALNFAKNQSGKPYMWGAVGPEGYDCSGFWSAIINVIQGNPPHRRLFTSAGLVDSPPSYLDRGAGGRMATAIGAFKGNPGHVAGNLGGYNFEATPAFVRYGPSARGASDSMFTHQYHMRPGLFGNGGIVKGGHGGVLGLIGERSHDELITPLPTGFDISKAGSKELHFHGDLSFPNITSADDAEAFIENLEALAD